MDKTSDKNLEKPVDVKDAIGCNNTDVDITERVGPTIYKPYPKIFKDAEGNTLPIRVIDGYMYAPTWIRPTLHEDLKQFQTRPDDIWLISYPRSGNHWVTNICWLLLHERMSDKFEEEPYMIDGHNLTAEKLPSPRIMRSHMHYSDHFPQDVFRQKNKVIYLYRDGRDVAVSLYKHITQVASYQYSGTWNGFLPNFLDGILPYGSWFKHVDGWMKKCRVNSEFMLAISYEDFKKDPVGTIARISSFLELQKTEAEIREVAEKTSFKCMKKRDEFYQQFAKDQVEGTMYRLGITGDWASMFTSEQCERFNHKHQEILSDAIPL
ncbi:unnamed protein product [Owenia fusiformis]|uniref:Sulfotransferase domain-containing protein n=1 Tax=Owenia fusiformis TaxID=6347 RepID=A0A8J1TGG0_OWEFU|nr:unnamed protein product [Owenia fusiformis]